MCRKVPTRNPLEQMSTVLRQRDPGLADRTVTLHGGGQRGTTRSLAGGRGGCLAVPPPRAALCCLLPVTPAGPSSRHGHQHHPAQPAAHTCPGSHPISESRRPTHPVLGPGWAGTHHTSPKGAPDRESEPDSGREPAQVTSRWPPSTFALTVSSVPYKTSGRWVLSSLTGEKTSREGT